MNKDGRRGPSGLYLAYKLKTLFTDYTLEVYGKNEDIGGTWFENRYPGCEHMYTYYFVPKCNWPAIARVVGANWDDVSSQWNVRVEDSKKEVFERRSDFLINATSYLNSWRWPSMPGLGSFNGRLLHTANWDESLPLTGKRVGSSGKQLLPELQKTYEEKQTLRDNPRKLLQLRKDIEANYTTLLPLFLKDTVSQKAATQRSKNLITDAIKHPFRCRRLTPSTDYLESLKKPNITPSGGIMLDGSEYAFDVLVCATGFQTSFRPVFSLTGCNGTNLAEVWEKQPRSYRGIAAHSFRNYFMVLGPNSPLANSPLLICIEAQGHYIAKFLNQWQKEDTCTFEPKLEAVDDFMEQKDSFMKSTIWENDCQSWSKNANTGKVSGLWPGSGLSYIEALAVQRFEDFHITYVTKNRFAYLGNGFSQRYLQPESDLTYYVRHEDNGESSAHLKRDSEPFI
ncbi:hypothetical protein BDV39DRAFT_192217 [Aspergillus sergii]|uniref:Monooxygenase n=1 Tax=Aspergillus sergii TaxID=1034303 RepID=A0A5N6X535_9EURO|nr:hypothetical protein BDV39DRAFT_192217 [Aspergillus sergii]